jgi:alkanesulfonate monooxygenase SsuD/methylene tetrahydromethanopterin reductase-like flavin-dependent oxidoreductase (luciferase family)
MCNNCGVLFGVNISPAVEEGWNPVAVARLAEQLGYDFISLNDHIHGPDPRFEAWTLLTWIAASTSRIRVLPRVLGVPYRNAAVTAKMAESLARLSDGRLILGLGAGSGETEFRALGLEARPLGERFDGLIDAIRIVRGLWRERSYTYGGNVYSTTTAQLEPKPAHEIPIWLGTHGPRGARLTGELADGWIPSYGYAPPDSIAALRQVIDKAAQATGRTRPVTSIYNIEVHVGEGPAARNADVSGSNNAVAQALISLLDLGFDGFNFFAVGASVEQQLEKLATEVVPAIRERAAG